MRILALESSVGAGSVALAEGPRLLAEEFLPAQHRSARSLAPGIRRLLDNTGWSMPDIEIVAVTIGPGSFTGLRVGVATAKTLTYALAARCVGLNTLEVIAAQAPAVCSQLSVAIDAQRGEVFAALYECAEPAGAAATWQMISAPSLLEQDEWLASLVSGTAVSGPALAKPGNRLPGGVTVIDQQQWSPRAATVAALAWRRHLCGAYDDVWKLAPLYLRKSAAEEKWQQRLR